MAGQPAYSATNSKPKAKEASAVAATFPHERRRVVRRYGSEGLIGSRAKRSLMPLCGHAPKWSLRAAARGHSRSRSVPRRKGARQMRA
jgi:hypothetical protein